MSSWYGAARSNYVTIIDSVGLQEALKPFGNGLDISPSDEDPDKHCFLSNTEDGGWPSWGLVYRPAGPDDTDFDEGDEVEDEVEFDVATQIMPYVAEGEVLVCMQAGHHKMRYVTGHAVAYVRRGAEVRATSIDIDQIYHQAAEMFSLRLDSITRCAY
jgi:hypothetical protein